MCWRDDYIPYRSYEVRISPEELAASRAEIEKKELRERYFKMTFKSLKRIIRGYEQRGNLDDTDRAKLVLVRKTLDEALYPF